MRTLGSDRRVFREWRTRFHNAYGQARRGHQKVLLWVEENFKHSNVTESDFDDHFVDEKDLNQEWNNMNEDFVHAAD